MGRPPLSAKVTVQAGEPINPQQPWELPEEGCPGGWYRGRFVASLHQYLRTRTEHGGRNSNPLLDRCDDELIVQLVLYLEHEQESALTWREEQAADG